MKKMMQKLIAILSGFMLSAFSVVPYVPVNADNDNGFVSSEGAETAFDSVRNESNVTTTLQTQITTTSTTGVSTTTVTTTANPRGYDFDGTILQGNYEWQYYLNDELDLSKLTLEVAIIDARGDYRTDYVECNFSYESGKYSDLYTLDTSKVDMSTPGEYKIYIRSKKDAIGDFETFPSRFLSAGHYKVRMDGHESYFTITVRDIERPVEVEDTDFRFVNHQGSNDCVSITKGMSAAVALYGYKLKEIMENYNAPSVFTFEIGDESIARLNTDFTKGPTVLLNGLEIGETTLTATAPNGKTATIKIIVHEYEEPVDYPQTTTTTAHTSMSETETTTTTTTAMIHPDYRTLAEYDKSPMKVGTTRKIIFKHPETGTADDLYYVGEATDNITVTHEKGTNYVVVTALSEGKASFYAAAKGCAFPVSVQLEITAADEFTGMPEKIVYQKGEELDLSGIKAADGKDAEIAPEEITLTGPVSSVKKHTAKEFATLEDGKYIVRAGNLTFNVYIDDPEDPSRYVQLKNARVTEAEVKNGPVYVNFDGIDETFYYDADAGMRADWTGVTMKKGDVVSGVLRTSERGSNATYIYCGDIEYMGDANCNRDVEISDAVLIMQTICNPAKYKLTAQGRINADSDGGGITNADALNIQKKLLGVE